MAFRNTCLTALISGLWIAATAAILATTGTPVPAGQGLLLVDGGGEGIKCTVEPCTGPLCGGTNGCTCVDGLCLQKSPQTLP